MLIVNLKDYTPNIHGEDKFDMVTSDNEKVLEDPIIGTPTVQTWVADVIDICIKLHFPETPNSTSLSKTFCQQISL